MADLLLNIIGSDGASAPMRSVAASFQELAKLAAECTKAFEEQAKADRQLERYAKDLTPAFKAQATAMQEQLGVSDDMVESMQTMLLRFGEAPNQVEATTRALLDYSSATGTDALSATQTLLGSVNSGKAAFKDLGLEYEKTNKKSADLVAVTKALAGKLGGSAQAEADSVTGQARIAKQAIGEFQESVGGLINTFIAKSGAVGTFTQAIRDLQVVLFGAPEDALIGLQKNLDTAKEKLEGMRSGWADAKTLLSGGAFGPSGDDIEQAVAEVARLERAYNSLAEKRRLAVLGGKNPNQDMLPGLDHDDDTNRGKKEKAEHANKLSDFESYAEAMTRAEFKRADDQAAALKKLAEDREAAHVKDLARDAQDIVDEDKHQEAKRYQMQKVVELQEKIEDDKLKAAEKAAKKLSDAAAAQNKKFEATMEQAAEEIGHAFVNGLENALQQAMSGEEVDGVEVGLDILSTILSIAGMAIGTYVGGAAGGAVGSAAGSLAGYGIKALYKNEKKKKHDGGMVDDFPRYHSGRGPGLSTDEEMTILQRGEMVFSRNQVANAGGPMALDRMRRGMGGGGGGNITIVAQDSKGIREFFEGAGGRGLFNAQRTGRGDVAGLFGVR